MLRSAVRLARLTAEPLSRELMHPSMQRIHDDVAEFGWHVVAVKVDGTTEDIFAFTVGLFQTHEHPELVIVGLPMKSAHGILSTCVQRIEEGKRFEDGQARTDVLNRFTAAVVEVDRSHYSEYLGSAIGFYESEDFPVLQIVWPDRNNLLPWQAGYDHESFGSQTVLAKTAA